MENEKFEQTLVLIKPDALKNSLTGYILSQLSEYHTGLRFAAAKIVNVSTILAEEHYAEHKGKGFFPSLIEYIIGAIHFPNDPDKRRVKAFVFYGPNAIKKVREISGPTNPHNARNTQPGCIRALGTLVPLKDEKGNTIDERMDNLIHASSSPTDAEREIKLWFKPTDMPAKLRSFPTTVCEEHFYYIDKKLTTQYTKGSVCLFAPGTLVWKSDLEALQAYNRGETPAISLEAVAAKYLINLE
jgi:nucleoside-diphosphate kinase